MNSTKTTLFSWSCQWLETTSYAFDSANVFVSPISVKWSQLWEITPPIKHMITCGKMRSRWVCIFPWWVSFINIMPLCWFPSQTIVNFVVLALFYQNKHSLDLCINNVSFNLQVKPRFICTYGILQLYELISIRYQLILCLL